MKRNTRFLCLLCALALGASLLSPASATGAGGKAVFWSGYVYCEDIQALFFREDGRTLPPLWYKGTVYVTLRTAGDWLGCAVGWDRAPRAASLTSGGKQWVPTLTDQKAVETPAQSEQYQGWMKNGMAVQERPDITIQKDGAVQRFTDAGGNTVSPITADGLTLIPIRGAVQMCGKMLTYVPGPPIPQALSSNGFTHTGMNDVIYVHTPVTADQKKALQSFLDQGNAAIGDLEQRVNEFLYAKDFTQEQAVAKLNTMLDCLTRLRRLETPAPMMSYACGGVKILAQNMAEHVSADISRLNREGIYVGDGTYLDLKEDPWFYKTFLEKLNDVKQNLKPAQRLLDALNGL